MIVGSGTTISCATRLSGKRSGSAEETPTNKDSTFGKAAFVAGRKLS